MKKSLVLCCFMILSMLTACQSQKPSVQVRRDVYTVELGIPISRNPKDYLDLEDYSDADKETIIDHSQMELDISNDDLIVRDNISYEKAGTYFAKIYYNNASIPFEIHVIDKRAPQIKGPHAIEVDLNQNYNYQKDFSAYDYGEVESLEVDDSKIDMTHKGTYFLNIKAIDTAKNENTKKVTVYVDTPQVKKESVHMNIPYYNQLDADAPNGCEATALYMALNYKKKMSIDLYTFIDNLPRSNSPYDGFFGDPFSGAQRSDDYYVIFPSPLIQYGSQYSYCRDISGSSLEDICYELSLDNPVVFYGTGGFKEPRIANYYFGDVIKNIHIVVLSGYDNTKGVFYVDDPISEEITEISYQDFEKIYNTMQYAITVE